jgi:hypothetical protein
VVSAAEAKNLDSWHRLLSLSACVGLPLATIEAGLHLLLSVVDTMPFSSQASHQPRSQGVASGG